MQEKKKELLTAAVAGIKSISISGLYNKLKWKKT